MLDQLWDQIWNGFHVAEFEDRLSISCPDGDDCETCGEICPGCGAVWRYTYMSYGYPCHALSCYEDCPVAEDLRMFGELARLSPGIMYVNQFWMYTDARL